MRTNKKAISPVIATIIIVAVAIVMSIAVAYWLMGLGATFTRYERLEIPVAYAERKGTQWNVTLHIKNTGSSDATINIILVNGRLDSNATVIWGNTNKSLSETNLGIIVSPGKEERLIITLKQPGYMPGQAVEIMVQTAAGYQYPKSVVLP